jgi:hypothetical protein
MRSVFLRVSTLAFGFITLLFMHIPASSVELYDSNHDLASCRFGFGVSHEAVDPTAYDMDSLNAGWYWDWRATASPTLPELDHAQTVRLSPTATGYRVSPNGAALLAIVAARPGATWFIGNEPDCIWQDNLRSEVYAEAYHDLYTFIKEADPTARIGAGGIVQPTPQRLRYLDRVLAVYETCYGHKLPADLWVIHNYILCENCFDDAFAWGACPVPDWSDEPPADAVYHSPQDHWRVDIFADRIETFRDWMRMHGYRDLPLVVSEYGILFYDDMIVGRTMADNIGFMEETFAWMREARDPAVGYRADADRLVQQWAWYSLAHDGWYMGGSLFDFETKEPLPLGLAYAAYSARVPPQPALHVVLDHTVNGSDVALTAQVSNAGDLPMTGPVTVTLSFGNPAQEIDQRMVRPLAGCGDVAEMLAVRFDLADGAYSFCVEAVAEDTSVHICRTVLINPETVYLPVAIQGQ